MSVDRPRQEFPEGVKAAAFERAFEKCERCKTPLTWLDDEETNARFNHYNPDYFGGAPTVENCEVLCIDCDKKVTYGKDIPAIAKSRRIRAREAGIRKDRKITRWRRFNGEIVIAPRRR